MDREFKVFDFKLETIEDEGVFEGITAVMGNLDDGNDIIENGAFIKTIQERAGRIKGLWQHDMFQPPIGVTLEMREVDHDNLPAAVVEKAPEATGGLFIKGKIIPTSLGRDVLVGMREGVINEMSIGYDPIKWELEEVEGSDYPIRRLKEIRLWEWSPVNWGMNSATHIGNVKSLEALLKRHGNDVPDLDKLINRLIEAEGESAWLDQVGKYIPFWRDKAESQIEEIKAGRVLSASNMERINGAMDQMRQAIDALESLLEAAKPPEDEEDMKRALTAGRERLARRVRIQSLIYDTMLGG